MNLAKMKEIEAMHSDTDALLPDAVREVVIDHALDVMASVMNTLYEMDRPIRVEVASIETTGKELGLASGDFGRVAGLPANGLDLWVAAFTVEDKRMTVYHFPMEDGSVVSCPFVRLADEWKPLFFGVRFDAVQLSPLKMASHTEEAKFDGFMEDDDNIRLMTYTVGSFFLMIDDDKPKEKLH